MDGKRLENHASTIVQLTQVRIETLLEEAYNERMHLLTFLKMAEPGWFMKFMILGAQGVFFNGELSSCRGYFNHTRC
jgi:hypothetical protein